MQLSLNNKWVKILGVCALILLPIVVSLVSLTSGTKIYRHLFYPKRIVILTGKQGGLYRQLGENLKHVIETKLNIAVELPESNGALDNIMGLQKEQADFALYQPGTLEALTQHDHSFGENLATVANLYSQPLHLIVRRGALIETPADLKGKRVQLGLRNSGDYAMSLILLKHLGIPESELDVQHHSYSELVRSFQAEEIDAALITLGVQAPVFTKLFEIGKCHLLDIPFVDALLTKHVSLSAYTIPQGLYRSTDPVEPVTAIQTIACGAQLLTRTDLSSSLVYEITSLLMNEDFLRRNHLGELYEEGVDFAERKPEFAIHTGAANYFHSLFELQGIESLEAVYSLTASILLACFLLFQTLKRRAERNKEHKLDQYVRKLLKIERSQLDLDQRLPAKDIDELQRMLDEVALLKEQALQEFTAHELNEDRAVDSFIEMCHALNDKINAKLSRQRLDLAVDRLVATVQQFKPGNDEPSRK